jgi:uncharacterized protein (DUF305 family)
VHIDDQPVITGEPAGYNSDDVAFADNVVPIEEQGSDLSALVADRSTKSGLVAFAAKNAAALRMDVQVLKAFRVQWNESRDNQTDGGRPGSTTGGMVDNATIAKLESLRGAEFDTLWLKSMISLDQGAIEKANTEIAKGKNADAIGLAKQIAEARQADSGLMQQMLSG